jgi:hypothetical protein
VRVQEKKTVGSEGVGDKQLAMQQVRAKVLNAQKAVHETFFSVKVCVMIFEFFSGICNCLFLLYPSEIMLFSCSFLSILFSGICNRLFILYLPIRDHAILMQLSSPLMSCILLRFFTWWVDMGLGIQSFVLSLLQDIFEKHNVVFTIGASLASAGAAWAGSWFFLLLYLW